MFTELNRGKRSVTLDLKRPEAQAALRVLAARSDVLVDSFRPGVLARCGLAPEDLMRDNPRLIYCAMTGFGLTGPDALRAGHDIGYLARGGALALSGPEEAPHISGVQIADIGASFVALSGVLAALLERSRTGRGKVVDVSLTEVGLAFATAGFGMLHGGALPRRGHEILDGSRPCYSVYRTKDRRFLGVGALEPKFWAAFVKAIGLPELELSGLDSGESGKQVRATVQARLLEKTRDEWAAVFCHVEACVEPVLEIDEIEHDPQHVARRILDPGGMVRSPVRIVDRDVLSTASAPDAATPACGPTHGRVLGHSPALGEHTEAVLREAGLDDALVRALL